MRAAQALLAKCQRNSALQKADGDRFGGALMKMLADAVDLEQRLELIEAQPLPGGPAQFDFGGRAQVGTIDSGQLAAVIAAASRN